MRWSINTINYNIRMLFQGVNSMFSYEDDGYQKKLKTTEEKRKFIEYYFWHIEDENFVRSLNRFKEKKGFGTEYVRILFHADFDGWEEYMCNEGEVAFIMDYPAAEEDTIGYLGFEQFYIFLLEYSEKYIEKYPEQEVEVSKLLREIKDSFNIGM